MNLQPILTSSSKAALCCLALMFIPVLQTGCSKAGGGYDSPDGLVSISGTVTLDGEPLNGATISFLPSNDTLGTGGYAITDEAGNFVAMHYSQAEGLESGDYNVIFSKLLMENGQPIAEGVDAADVGAVESLPAHLTRVNPENHNFRITVTQSPQKGIELDLKSK